VSDKTYPGPAATKKKLKDLGDGSYADVIATDEDNPLSVSPAGTTAGADQSANAPAVGNVLKTIAANASRGGFYIQNQSAVTLQVVLDHATGSPTIVLVDPGSGANAQGGDWSFSQAGVRHTGQIRIAGLAGSQFGAMEF
jgi:hypothetical protein